MLTLQESPKTAPLKYIQLHTNLNCFIWRMGYLPVKKNFKSCNALQEENFEQYIIKRFGAMSLIHFELIFVL